MLYIYALKLYVSLILNIAPYFFTNYIVMIALYSGGTRNVVNQSFLTERLYSLYFFWHEIMVKEF